MISEKECLSSHSDDTDRVWDELFGNDMFSRVAVCALATAVLVGWSGTANAQSVLQPPVVSLIDQVGVDLASQEYIVPGLEIGIGTSSSGLQLTAAGPVGKSGIQANSYSDSLSVTSEYSNNVDTGPVFAYASYAGKSYKFLVGNWFVEFDAQLFISGPYKEFGGGAVLNCTDKDMLSYVGSCSLTVEDGTTVFYSRSQARCDINEYCATLISRPDGEQIGFNYIYNSIGVAVGLKTVWSSLGWMLKFQGNFKALDGASLNGVGGSWYLINQVTAVNLSTSYCDISASSCSVGSELPNAKWTDPLLVGTMVKNGIPLFTVAYEFPDPSVHNVQTMDTVITKPSGVTTRIKHVQGDACPMPSSPEIVGRASAVTVGSSTWNYSFVDNRCVGVAYETYPARIINPDSTTRSVIVNRNHNVASITDELNRKTVYQYDEAVGAEPLLRGVISPEGNSSSGFVKYSYDSGARVIGVTSVPKSGSALPSSTATALYDCSVSVCRNKPTQVTDARGSETDYTYDTTHGGILTETGPADAHGVRPQTRYSYNQLTPKVLDASGNLVNSPPVYRLTRTSTCRSASPGNPASCVGSGDETVTTYTYNTNNLLLTSETVAAGDGSASATTSYGYDVVGNRIWVDGPRTDVDDKSYTTYDLLRRPVFEIGPDPDGPGSQLRQIVKHNYDGDGHEYLTQYGTGQATDGSDFSVVRFKRNSYDATTGKLVKTELGQP